MGKIPKKFRTEVLAKNSPLLKCKKTDIIKKKVKKLQVSVSQIEKHVGKKGRRLIKIKLAKERKLQARAEKEKQQELYLLNLKNEPDLLAIQNSRSQARDNRSIFITNAELPNGKFGKITELLPEVVGYRGLPKTKNLYVEFKNEASTKNACRLLENGEAKLGDEVTFSVVGKNSKEKVEKDKIFVYQRVLYVCSIPAGTKLTKIQKKFPKATKIWPKNKKTGNVGNFVFLRFEKTEDARDVFLSSEDVSIRGCSLTVLFSKSQDKGQTFNKKGENKKDSNKKKGKLNLKIKKKQADLKTKIKGNHKKAKASKKKGKSTTVSAV